jgi:hypothetical protein
MGGGVAGEGAFCRPYTPPRQTVGERRERDGLRALREQIDIVIYDRQYSPFLFNQNGAKYVAAESVYIGHWKSGIEIAP